MIKKVLSVFFCVLSFLFFYSCEKESVSMADAGTTKKIIPKDTTPITTISFKHDVLPIFTQNCVRCHDSNSPFSLDSNDAFKSLSRGTFINKSDPEKGLFFLNKIVGHPDDYLIPEEHDIIVIWIKEGARNN